MRSIATSLVLLLLAAPSARADEQERRLTLQATAAHVTIDAFSTSDSSAAFGGALGFDVGATNWLELGADAAYLTRSNFILHDAKVDGVGGDGFDLFANLHTAELAGHARLTLNAVPFYRVRPITTLRAGLGLRLLLSPELFEPGGNRVPTASDADVAIFPFLGVEAGLSWRLSDGFQVSFVGTSTIARDHHVLGAQLAVSWLSYDWF